MAGAVEAAAVDSTRVRPLGLAPHWIARLPRLGVGLGFRRPLARPTIANAAQIDFLEIIADHYFDFTRLETRELSELSRRFPLVPHSLSLSPGTIGPPDRAYLRCLDILVNRIDPPWWSDHIAITRAGAIDIGHLAPVPLTEQMLTVVCDNVNRAKARVGRPFIIENIAYTLRLPGAAMSEADFLREVLERTDSGLLLDLMNLHANSRNHGYDPYKFLSSIPLSRVVQVHIIGGHCHGGILVDSHSRPTPEEVWRLLEFVAAATEIKAVLLEWDEQFPGFDVIIGQLARARAIVSGSTQRRQGAKALRRDGSEVGADRREVVRMRRSPSQRLPVAPRAGFAALGSCGVALRSLTASSDSEVCGGDAELHRIRSAWRPEATSDSEAVIRERQDSLARLCVDPAFLSQFLADREGFMKRHGPSAGSLAEMGADQLRFFANSLVLKRANEVKKLLPMTVAALGGAFFERFARFAGATLPSGHKKHAADAMAFARMIADCALRNSAGAAQGAPRPDLATEAARFEFLKLSMRRRLIRDWSSPSVVRAATRRLPWVRLARLSGALRPLIEGADPAREPGEQAGRLTVLFVSFWGSGGVWYWT